MFNTLKYSRILEATGVSREQAEAHIQIMAEIVEGELATKQDIREARQEIQTSADSMKQEVKVLESKMDSKFEQMEYRLIIRLTAILVPVISLTIAVMTFLMKKI